MEIEQSEERKIMSQTNNTVELQCIQGTDAGQIWSLRCVDGQWVTNNRKHPDCLRVDDHTRDENKTVLAKQAFEQGGFSGRLLYTMHWDTKQIIRYCCQT